MIGKARFWIYRNAVAFLIARAFRSQRVEPILVTEDIDLRFRPYAEAFPDLPLPRLYDPLSFPGSDGASARLRRIKLTKFILAGMRAIAPRRTAPVPDNEADFLRAVYPRSFRKAWPTPPRWPAELDRDADVVAALATRGPFGSYLRKTDDGSGQYEIDMSWMERYPAIRGLRQPGGRARLDFSGGTLRTVDGGDTRLLLAALNEDLTTFRHNVSVHLSMLTPFALMTTNRLPTNHPIRRLLHASFHTVLVGNREIAELQLSGRRGFATRIFSHDHKTLAQMVGDYLEQYDFWDFEPPTQFARRGTTTTPFPYPYRDNVLQLWEETHTFVHSYLRLYYPTDETLAGDTAVARWLQGLDELIPNGVSPPPGPIPVEWLVRLCATLIHVSTVEHDVLNNIVWNFSTINWIIPTVVPESEMPMDQRRAFDLIATLIGTWKPYNMLLSSDLPGLALDEGGRRAIEEWLAALRLIQEKMASEPPDQSLSYPVNLNVSVSN